METSEQQVLRAAEGDYSTTDWPIGGICRIESRDNDWALVTQWGTSYLLKKKGLVQMIDECEKALDSDLGLDDVADKSDIVNLWEAMNTEVDTRQKCAGSLNARLDALTDRVLQLEATMGAIGVTE